MNALNRVYLRAIFTKWIRCILIISIPTILGQYQRIHFVSNARSKWYMSFSGNRISVKIMWLYKVINYGDVIMSAIASQITSLTIVFSTTYSNADQIEHQSSASLAFVLGIHRGLVNSPHKWPVTWKMFPVDDVIMIYLCPMSNFKIFSDVSNCIVPEYHHFPQGNLIYLNIYSWHPKDPPWSYFGGLLILK